MGSPTIIERLRATAGLALLLAVTWVTFTADFSPANLVVAVVFGVAIALWVAPLEPSRHGRIAWRRLLPFAAWVTWQLIRSSAAVAIDIVRPTPRRKPAVVDVPVEATAQWQVTVLAQVITLTPGTVVMGLSEDGRWMRVHGMFVNDPDVFIHQIKHEFERRVMEVLPCRAS